MPLIEIGFWLSVGLVVYAYAGYPICLLALHPFLRANPTLRGAAHQPSVSVIMAAYNEERTIREKLENCLALDYPQDRLQILVGSDGSEDATNAIVEEFADRGVQLLAFSPNRGKMSTVNRTVRAASGEICVFSDITEMFDRDAISKLVRHFRDPTIGVVAGNHIFNDHKSSIGAGARVYRQFKRFLWRVESRWYSTCRCDGCIYACRRELFPFPPDTTINDDVAVPLGILSRHKRVVFEPEAVVRGDVDNDTRVFFRQKVRCQAGRYQNLFQYPRMYNPWFARRCWTYLSHVVLPILVPWFMLAALLCNAALWQTGNWLYQSLFLLQVAFYLSASAGFLAERLGLHFPAIAVPFYFVAANVGSLIGFFAYLLGRQRVTWRKPAISTE